MVGLPNRLNAMVPAVSRKNCSAPGMRFQLIDLGVGPFKSGNNEQGWLLEACFLQQVEDIAAGIQCVWHDVVNRDNEPPVAWRHS